jgi:hypothetical protein
MRDRQSCEVVGRCGADLDRLSFSACSGSSVTLSRVLLRAPAIGASQHDARLSV